MRTVMMPHWWLFLRLHSDLYVKKINVFDCAWLHSSILNAEAQSELKGHERNYRPAALELICIKSNTVPTLGNKMASCSWLCSFKPGMSNSTAVSIKAEEEVAQSDCGDSQEDLLRSKAQLITTISQVASWDRRLLAQVVCLPTLWEDVHIRPPQCGDPSLSAWALLKIPQELGGLHVTLPRFVCFYCPLIKGGMWLRHWLLKMSCKQF